MPKNVLQTFMQEYLGMLIKFNCLMPVLTAFIVWKKRFQWSETCKRNGSGRPRFVAVVYSLKCFGNDLICWQLISANETKQLPGLQFKSKAGKRPAVPPGNWISHQNHAVTVDINMGKPPINESVNRAKCADNFVLFSQLIKGSFVLDLSILETTYLAYFSGQRQPA